MAELDEKINKLYESTIGGFNSMIEQQKKAKDEALVSTVLTQQRPQVSSESAQIVQSTISVTVKELR